MDFTDRGSRPTQPANPQFNAPAPNPGSAKKSSKNKGSSWVLWGAGILGLLIVALVACVILVIGFGGPKKESTYVDSSKLQAVFLQTGQVYFGNITNLNSKYFVLSNIYYLQTSSTGTSTTQTAQNTNVSLVKLGCELHAPYDQMVLNRDQITFWENLQSDGQVAKAVATFKKDNPNGQKCTDQSAAPNTTSGTGVQSTSGTGTSSTGTSSTSGN